MNEPVVDPLRINEPLTAVATVPPLEMDPLKVALPTALPESRVLLVVVIADVVCTNVMTGVAVTLLRMMWRSLASFVPRTAVAPKLLPPCANQSEPGPLEVVHDRAPVPLLVRTDV